ncbi:hypothetical protein [Streptomyces spectabilis]|nr:hypothetical protein [Streptomyces spectabilis]MBB5108397.1 DNA-binding XRE family transcriptional regulator [Streptomyces spectabilis]MCI3901151.1 helix-turn-helix domain-containing protein [Streptomyces spectabilis]
MAVPHDDLALQRLARLVRQRRVELGMNKIDVAKAADITINTYMKVEDGRPVRDVTYGKIEPVFKWAASTCRDILAGATAPTTIEPSAPQSSISPVSVGDLAADVEDAVQNAAISVSDDLTAAQIRALKQGVIDELRKRGRIPDIERN